MPEGEGGERVEQDAESIMRAHDLAQAEDVYKEAFKKEFDKVTQSYYSTLSLGGVYKFTAREDINRHRNVLNTRKNKLLEEKEKELSTEDRISLAAARGGLQAIVDIEDEDEDDKPGVEEVGKQISTFLASLSNTHPEYKADLQAAERAMSKALGLTLSKSIIATITPFARKIGDVAKKCWESIKASWGSSLDKKKTAILAAVKDAYASITNLMNRVVIAVNKQIKLASVMREHSAKLKTAGTALGAESQAQSVVNNLRITEEKEEALEKVHAEHADQAVNSGVKTQEDADREAQERRLDRFKRLGKAAKEAATKLSAMDTKEADEARYILARKARGYKAGESGAREYLVRLIEEKMLAQDLSEYTDAETKAEIQAQIEQVQDKQKAIKALVKDVTSAQTTEKAETDPQQLKTMQAETDKAVESLEDFVSPKSSQSLNANLLEQSRAKQKQAEEAREKSFMQKVREKLGKGKGGPDQAKS